MKFLTLIIIAASLPYPKLHVYAQSLIDTQNGVDLEDLIDGMDLTEEWGEQNLDLEGDTDSQWAQERGEALTADGAKFTVINPNAVPRRQYWQESVRNKKRRLGWKYSPEMYATRFRRHGSKDPRLRGMSSQGTETLTG